MPAGGAVRGAAQPLRFDTGSTVRTAEPAEATTATATTEPADDAQPDGRDTDG
jgi:hypothetical protein